MKTYLLCGAAFCALGATAALAAPRPVSGSVGVNVGATFSDNDYYADGDGTSFVFGGDAHINAWLDDMLSVQLDVQAEGTGELDQGGPSSYQWDGRSGGIFGAHLSWRDPDSHLIGVFGGFSSQSNLDWDGTMAHVVLGAEGQYYDGPFTFYGQVGYLPLMSDSNEYEPTGIWFLRGVVRYFCNPNDRIQLDVSYGDSNDVHGYPGASYDYWNAGLSWQHRYENSPFSTTIAYSGMWGDSDLPGTSGNSVSENIVSVGFAIHFGDSTLQQSDREGATLDMPNFNRAEAWSYWLGN
jgi:hypothetical protein